MKEIDQKKVKLAVFATFLANGILFSSWLPYIPLVQRSLKLNNGVLGLTLLAIAVGSLISMPFTGALCGKFGSKKVTLTASLLFTLILPLTITANSLIFLISILLLFGAFNGAMGVAMNSQAVTVEKHFAKKMMSSFHGFYSIGGLSGVTLGGLLIELNITPLFHLGGISVLIILLLLFSNRYFLSENFEPDQTKSVAFVFPKGALLKIGALAFIVLMAEGAMADWGAVFMQQSVKANAGLAAMGYGAFSLMMAIGRLSGDRFTAKIGENKLISITAIIAGGGLSIVLMSSHYIVAIIGFAIVGLGLSNLIPILFRSASQYSKLSPGASIAAVSSAGYLGFLAGPPVIGLIAEVSSLTTALWFVVGLIFIVAFFGYKTRKENIQCCC